MLVLSGAIDEVERVLDAYEVPRERDEKTGDVVHPGLVHVLNPSGEIVYTFNNPPTKWLTSAVRKIVG